MECLEMLSISQASSLSQYPRNTFMQCPSADRHKRQNIMMLRNTILRYGMNQKSGFQWLPQLTQLPDRICRFVIPQFLNTTHFCMLLRFRRVRILRWIHMHYQKVTFPKGANGKFTFCQQLGWLYETCC